MMKHRLDIALSTTNFLNEGEISVVCSDQLLYAICKQLQFHIEKQIEQDIKDVYVDASQAIYVPIKQNNIKLFGGKNIQKNKAQVKISLLKYATR